METLVPRPLTALAHRRSQTIINSPHLPGEKWSGEQSWISKGPMTLYNSKNLILQCRFDLVHQTVSPRKRVGSGDETTQTSGWSNYQCHKRNSTHGGSNTKEADQQPRRGSLLLGTAWTRALAVFSTLAVWTTAAVGWGREERGGSGIARWLKPRD